MSKMLSLVLLVVLAEQASGHAILITPAPRPGMDRSPGAKITPFDAALNLANSGCGGSRNRDPGVQIPTVSYKPGDKVEIKWKLTIPHPSDNEQSGVRVAVHYDTEDSFAQNILAGRVEGDPNPKPTVSAGDQTLTVTLPADKTCDYCTIQWIWAAKRDGGSYIGCADVSITADGTLPDFSKLPKQNGKSLPSAPAPAPSTTDSSGTKATPAPAPSTKDSSGTKATPAPAPSTTDSSGTKATPAPEPSTTDSSGTKATPAPAPSTTDSSEPQTTECANVAPDKMCRRLQRRKRCGTKWVAMVCAKSCGGCATSLSEDLWTEIQS